MSNITLNTKVYVGSGLMNGLANFIERSAAVAAGFSKLASSLRIDAKIRGKWTLDLPIVATADSACSCIGEVLRSGDVTVAFRMDLGMTTAERTDLADRLKDLVTSAQFRASIINLEVQP